MKTPRTEVFAAIEAELQHQYDRFKENPHEIDSFATYIRRYSTMLDELATTATDPNEKLKVVRQIAAIAVRCMEQHGAPKRNPGLL